jgi:hypothetical protein
MAQSSFEYPLIEETHLVHSTHCRELQSYAELLSILMVPAPRFCRVDTNTIEDNPLVKAEFQNSSWFALQKENTPAS